MLSGLYCSAQRKYVRKISGNPLLFFAAFSIMKAVKASVPKGRRSLLQASFRAGAAPGGPAWKEAENRRSERKVRVRYGKR